MRFFRSRDTAKVTKVVASRAVFESQDIQRVDVRFRNDDGDELTLEFHPDIVPNLILELSTAYEAIRPPLRGTGGHAAGWNGM